MTAEYSYLDGLTDSFVKCCDVLLMLDDGSELPAHTQILAHYSKVCADMLVDDGPLACALPSKQAHLPLTDCSEATATKLLSMLYIPHQYEYLRQDRESCMAIASLAHKLDMEGIVRMCDDFRSGMSDGPWPGSQVMISTALMEKSLKKFSRLLSSALQLGMKKVVAVCEFCIACDRYLKFDAIFSDLPFNSTVRIVRGMRRGYYTRGWWLPEDFLDRT